MKKAYKFSRILTGKAEIMDRTLDFIKRLNLNRNDYIVVGCSGGPDSMVLINILHENGYKVVCAHVNHNIRKESTDEYKFLKDYCKENEIVFEGLELQTEFNRDEYYYRKKRYAFYKDIAKKYSTKYIMTAHHGDDLIETILMRITRGSNLKGYLGFPKIYDEHGILFIKPLIFYTKDDILKYAKANDIPYVIDSSNDADGHTRNRYRHKILPFLKSENKDVHLKYLHYSEELEEAEEYLDRETQRELKKVYKNRKISSKDFIDLDPYIQKRCLYLIFKDIYGDYIDKIKSVHVNGVLSNIAKGENFEMSLPLGFKIKKEYDSITIDKEEMLEGYDFIYSSPTILPNGGIIETVGSSEDTSNYTFRLDTKTIKLPLHIRSMKEGDRMHIKNMQEPKKVSRIFIDAKVPKSVRKNIPLLVDDSGEILWIPGLRKSKFDNEKSGKYDIILKYTKKGNDQ